MLILSIEYEVELLVKLSRNRDDQDLRASIVPPESEFASAGFPLVFDSMKILRRDI